MESGALSDHHDIRTQRKRERWMLAYDHANYAVNGDISSQIKVLRDRDTERAAHDVLSFLPWTCLTNLHWRNEAYFYLQPSMGTPETSITVFWLTTEGDRNPSNFSIHFNGARIAGSNEPVEFPQPPYPRLTSPSMRSVLRLLRDTEPDLSFDVLRDIQLWCPGYPPSTADVLVVNWA